MRILPPFVVALATLASLPAAAQADHWFDKSWDGRAALEMPQRLVPGRVLVKLRGVDARALQAPGPTGARASKQLVAIADRTGLELDLVRPLLLGWGLFDLRDLAVGDVKARLTEDQTFALLDVLRDDADIDAVSADRWYRPLATPNDPALPDMWHLDAIGAPAAWDQTVGLSTQRIGVVDTGTLRSHVDLAGKDVGGFDFISSDNAAGDNDGRDADYQDEGDGANCGNGAQADSWHGSHVAGTILASADNGRGVPGLNWNAGLMTARVMGKCGGAMTDIMDGAAWLAGATIDGVPNIGADKVSVMNLSLGGEAACSTYEQNVIDYITGEGVVFVAAAGNNGGAVGSPASCSGVITVAAHGPGATRPLAPYSSFGGSVEVVAPGGNTAGGVEGGVLSVTGPGDESWTYQQGTSMASPHVTGAISLLQVFDDTLDRAALAALFAEAGATCDGCQGVPALRVDLLLEAVGATVEPPTDPQPDPDPQPEPDPTDPPVVVAGDDDREPNDSFDQMSPIVCGETVELATIDGNLDWHQLDVTSGTHVDVTITAGVDLDLYLTDGPNDGNVLDASTSPTGEEQVGGTGEGRTLALVVVPYQAASGDYTISVTCTPADEDPAPTPDPDVTEPPPVDDTPEPGEDPQQSDDPAGEDLEVPDTDPPSRVRADAQADPLALHGGCTQAGAADTAPLLAFLLLVGAVTLRRRRR